MGKRGPKTRVDIPRAVLILRADGYTFQEIGIIFDFSRQRAHQLYKQCHETLAEGMSCKNNADGVAKP